MSNNKSNIILVGPMGAGKSSVGRGLSLALSMEFHDTDKEIEARTGAHIAWIFDLEGEEGFRERETNIIAELTKLDNQVIATGGGSILRKKNREMLTQSGIVVYLKTSMNTQRVRTQRDEKRPLLQVENREETLLKLHAEREPLYQEIANYQFCTDNMSVRTIVNKVVKVIKKTHSYE